MREEIHAMFVRYLRRKYPGYDFKIVPKDDAATGSDDAPEAGDVAAGTADSDDSEPK